MLKAIKRVIEFMGPNERMRYGVFLFGRGVIAIFDLLGILIVGYLATSIALFVTQGSDPQRTIKVGTIDVAAVNATSISTVAFAIIVLFILKTILSLMLTKKLATFLAKIEARSAKTIAENVFTKGLENARRHSMQEVLFAIQVGSPNSFNFILNSLGTLVAEGFLFVLVLGAFIVVDPTVAIAAILYFGLIGFFIQFLIGRLVERAGEKAAKSTLAANEALSDLSEVLRESSILGIQKYFTNKIHKARLTSAGNTATQFVLAGLPRYVIETALALGIGAFVYFESLNGNIATSAGTLGIFLSGALRLIASMLPLQAALMTIRQAIPTSHRTMDLLAGQNSPAIDINPKELVTSVEPANVKIENLWFSYEGSTRDILKDISMEVTAGSQVAIIGGSGAGKSTLADIILGLLLPTRGQVLINEMDPVSLKLETRNIFGYVPQKPGMISGSISQNIALGSETSHIDIERLTTAIEDANLSSFISSLPEGLETSMGKRKDELSGGQLQRIGLARALYANPGLLIMDEATSALDAESENEIKVALDRLRGRTTVIMIAHRLNTIQKADRVYVMEDGQISDSGTFPELIKNNAKVQKLVELMRISQ